MSSFRAYLHRFLDETATQVWQPHPAVTASAHVRDGAERLNSHLNRVVVVCMRQEPLIDIPAQRQPRGDSYLKQLSLRQTVAWLNSTTAPALRLQATRQQGLLVSADRESDRKRTVVEEDVQYSASGKQAHARKRPLSHLSR